MRLTIIPVDGTVHVDDSSITGHTLNNIPTNIHALQWENDNGWLEFNNNKPNEAIDKLPDWALDACAVFTAEYEKIKAQELLVEEDLKELFWEEYPKANKVSVTTILNKQYSGITLKEGLDQTFNLKAIEVRNVASTPSALTSLKEITEACKKVGIPVVSDRNIDAISDNFVSYMKGLGFVRWESKAGNKFYLPWTTELATAASLQKVNQERDNLLLLGADWAGNKWDIDAESRSNLMNQLAAITANIYVSPNVVWRTYDNQNITLTIAEFKDLCSAVNSRVQEIYLNSFTEKDNV